MIFDTHAHYDDEAFEEDREALLESLKDGGIGAVMNVAASLESCRTTLLLAGHYDWMYAALGVHPSGTAELDEAGLKWMEFQCSHEKVRAVGEIGLDYYWDNESHDLQKEWFVRQLNLARELDLPVLIHSRDAAADTMEIMKQYGQGLDGVIHCFSYSGEMAEEYVKMGYYIGIGGVVTFKNARKMKEVVEKVPLESILLETDSPYLAPEPNRGKRNSSLNLVYVAQKIAEIKGITYEEVVAQTEQNARRMYRL